MVGAFALSLFLHLSSAQAQNRVVVVPLVTEDSSRLEPRERIISINPYGMFIEGNTRFDNGFNGVVGAQGVVMGDPTSGTSSITFGFSVPTDYMLGTQISVRIIWRSDAINCVIDLRNNTLVRIPINGGSTDTGNASRRETLTAPNNILETRDTLFDLLSLVQIEATDSITVGLFRSSINDTCGGDFHILGVQVVYQAQF